MGEFWYNVEASSESVASYISHLLRIHGLAYEWLTRVTPALGTSTIRITAGSNLDSTPHEAGTARDVIRTEVLLTRETGLLRGLGLNPPDSQEYGDSSWGYLIPTIDREQPWEAVPFPLAFTTPLRLTGSNWIEECLRFATTPGFDVVAASRTVSTTRQTVFGVDICGLLERCMLGPASVSGFEDWAEAYGTDVSQSLCDTHFIDRFLSVITDFLGNNLMAAFPARVWYYPPTRTAPLIITGDTDDATETQLNDYLETLESYRTRGSVIIRTFANFSESSLKAAMERGHCFGIHPYSPTAQKGPFLENYHELLANHQKVFGTPVYGVRNHRFQWISRNITVEVERETEAYFDLNCVAASGSIWLGSPSGVGFPIPFPPSLDRFSKFPRLLPTVLEDDVLLFSHDYSYRPLLSGDCLPIEAALGFLEDWLIVKKKPATLNLHPEHITPEKRWLLDATLEWATSMQIWNPNLQEFGSWINARDEVSLEVSGSDLSITSPVPFVLVKGRLDSDEASRITVTGTTRLALA